MTNLTILFIVLAIIGFTGAIWTYLRHTLFHGMTSDTGPVLL